MANNNLQFEDISYLLKKIEWPAPSNSLASRIQSAAAGEYVIPLMGDMHVVHFRSPFLTMMAVMMALFLGVASGVATSGTASASGVDEHPYGGSSLSVTGIYSGQIQSQGR
jgi:hypothetical protein